MVALCVAWTSNVFGLKAVFRFGSWLVAHSSTEKGRYVVAAFYREEAVGLNANGNASSLLAELGRCA